MREVGVEDLADRRPAQLSGGQAQRAAVARALAADPKLLLLDEPMAALDVAVTPALRQTLRRVLADRTVVMITHDVLDALLLADRVVVIESGAIVEQGTCAEVLSRPRSAFAARLAGLNLITGTWRDDGVLTPGGRRVAGQAAEPAPQSGDPVVAVFPPHAVSVFLEPPGGSLRNVLEVTITDLEPQSGWIRVRADELSADITPQAAAELDLALGVPAYFAVKATEVSVYGTWAPRPRPGGWRTPPRPTFRRTRVAVTPQSRLTAFTIATPRPPGSRARAATSTGWECEPSRTSTRTAPASASRVTRKGVCAWTMAFVASSLTTSRTSSTRWPSSWSSRCRVTNSRALEELRGCAANSAVCDQSG